MSIGSLSTCAIRIPYTTSTTLFPINIAPINLEGIRINLERIRAEKLPLFLSTSIFNRFALMNAISIPEKKAEKLKLLLCKCKCTLFGFVVLYSKYTMRIAQCIVCKAFICVKTIAIEHTIRTCSFYENVRKDFFCSLRFQIICSVLSTSCLS